MTCFHIFHNQAAGVSVDKSCPEAAGVEKWRY